MTAITLFTDGACRGNPGPGGWAAIVLDGDFVRELGGGEPQTTNNRMELMAAIEGLRAVAAKPEAVELFTDSTYVIKGITEWVAGWRRKGWKRADGGAVLNQDLWETLDALDAARRGTAPVTWLYVRGHSGNPGNERCDVIAVAFSHRKPPPLYSGPVAEYPYDLSIRPSPRSVERKVRSSASKSGAGKPAPSGRPVYLSVIGGKLERHMNWSDCERRVKGATGARYRKVTSPDEEREILRGWGIATD